MIGVKEQKEHKNVVSQLNYFSFWNDGFFEEKTYFQKESTPDFIKLWHQYDLEDSEFESIYGKVYKKFKAKEILDKCELLHVIGILLSLADRKVIQIKK